MPIGLLEKLPQVVGRRNRYVEGAVFGIEERGGRK